VLELRPLGAKAYEFAFRHPKRDARINILEGSVRSSKTTAMLVKMGALCCYHPGGRKIITGVSKQTIYRNVLNDLFDMLGESNYSYNRQSGELILAGDKWEVIGAKDEGSEKYIRGATLGLAYADECSLIPRSFWLMLLNRMSVKDARLYATTNPDNPFHYLKSEFLDNAELRRRGDLWSQHFTLEDNPHLSPDYIEFVKRAYTGVFYKRYIEGLWVMAEGAIYADSFTDDLLFDDTTAPIGLTAPGGYFERLIGVDYGTTNPCVFLEIFDDGQTLWVWREYYWDSAKQMKQKTDAEYADDLKAFIGPVNDAQVVIDPSAASFKVELIKRGVFCIDADNEVLDGIRMVSTMFSRKLVRVHKRCVNFIKEHQTYAWDPKKAQRGLEEPIKANDHTCDGFRYPVKTKINAWRLAA
jgi:PBSX family phage terminase large subunit